MFPTTAAHILLALPVALASLPAVFATIANRQAPATWSDDCAAAESSFILELEAIATSSVAPALQSYLATVVSSGVTNYCEPTAAPSIVSAEWEAEVRSIDAIINVYSADIAQVQSCLASYQTAAAGTPYQLASAASAVFSTISSLQACTVTSASLPLETGASGINNTTITSTGNGTVTTATPTGLVTTSATSSTGGASATSTVAAGAAGLVGAGAGLVGVVVGLLAVAML